MISKEMSHRRLRLVSTALVVVAIATVTPLFGSNRAFGGRARLRIGRVSEVSSRCAGAEVHQAVDPKAGYVYEVWTGCGGIGFARSMDGGRSYSSPASMPGSARADADDPAVAAAPDGVVFVSFMVHRPQESYPVVAASFDHGARFPQVTPLAPARVNNWGDADFIAVGPDGTVYVTWDYGPNQSSIREPPPRSVDIDPAGERTSRDGPRIPRRHGHEIGVRSALPRRPPIVRTRSRSDPGATLRWSPTATVIAAASYSPTRRLIDPRVIMIHFTDSPDFSSTYNTLAADVADPEFHELPRTCAHFVIDRSGTIHQLVSLGIMCRHTAGLNWTAIGTEHLGLKFLKIASSSGRACAWCAGCGANSTSR